MVRLLFGSGYHYTFRTIQHDDQGNPYVWFGSRNKQTIPYYRRFDVGFTQEFKLFNTINITLREEVLNLFNRYNVLGYSWINGSRIEYGLSGRTFNIGMLVEF